MKSSINEEGQFGKQEKGKWRFEGNADRYMGDSQNNTRVMAFTTQTQRALNGYELLFIDPSKMKSKPIDYPNVPFVRYNQGNNGTYFIQK